MEIPAINKIIVIIVIVKVLVVWTGAIFLATEVAKLVSTPACHVVASVVLLNVELALGTLLKLAIFSQL